MIIKTYSDGSKLTLGSLSVALIFSAIVAVAAVVIAEKIDNWKYEIV